MSERTPKDLWERMRRALGGWMQPDGDDEVDEMALAFHLAYIAPLLLAFAFLLRR